MSLKRHPLRQDLLRQRRLQVVDENEELLTLLYKSSPQPFDESYKNTVWYMDGRKLQVKPAIVERKTLVEVWDMDTLDAAFKIQHKRPLVLNMASDFKPGGGYLKGSVAQEEELFRRTSLSWNLNPNRYPLPPYACCYSPNVYVFRNGSETMYARCKGWNVDILSMASLRNPRLDQNKFKPSDREIVLEKIRTIFKVGVLHNHTCLLLSAFGCGAFHNPPDEVALLFLQVIREFKNHYDHIIFSILPGPNYQTFKQLLFVGKE